MASDILVWKIPAAVMMQVKIEEETSPQHCSTLVTTYWQLIFNATGTAVIGVLDLKKKPDQSFTCRVSQN